MVDPVARLMVDVPLPHLDRPFDYCVPDTLDAQVAAGSRVRVRFAGRLVDAFVLERTSTTEHEGKLAFVERAVGEPVLTSETTTLFRAVADRWAGNFIDVVRLGVPSRHAHAEKSVPKPPGEKPEAIDPAGWHRYGAGDAFLSAVADGRSARAAWAALPGRGLAGPLRRSPPAPLSTPVADRCWWSLTSETSNGWTLRSPLRWVRGGTSRSRPISGRLSATDAGWPCGEDTFG